MNDFLFYITIGIISVLVMSKASNYAVGAMAHYAKTTGISGYLIGFLVISFGTTLPELSTAIMGSISGQGTLVLGNLIGTGIVNMTLVLGIAAIIGKKLRVEGEFKSALTILVLILVPLFLGIDGRLDAKDGIILLFTFGVYVFRMVKKEKSFSYMKKEISFRDVWKDMVIFLGCLMAMLLSAKWLLISALHIANIIHLPLYLMGLIFMGIITAVPELTIGIRSVLKGQTGIAFGNIVGSVVVDTILILGIAAILRPITFDRGMFIPTALFMITSVFIGTLFLNKGKITWKEGIGLLLIYLTFVVSEGLSI